MPDVPQVVHEHGADGLIARGSEGGGRIGELTTYVLLQMLLADTVITVPVWASGGLGQHRASAETAGGAAGVVLDAQLALMRESMIIPKEIAAAVSVMDGSETITVGGRRVYHRPDLPARARTLAGVGRCERREVVA